MTDEKQRNPSDARALVVRVALLVVLVVVTGFMVTTMLDQSAPVDPKSRKKFTHVQIIATDKTTLAQQTYALEDTRTGSLGFDSLEKKSWRIGFHFVTQSEWGDIYVFKCVASGGFSQEFAILYQGHPTTVVDTSELQVILKQQNPSQD